MSYCRATESGHYIYGTATDKGSGVQFDSEFITDDQLDVFLYCLFSARQDELKQRIEHGKEICDFASLAINYVNNEFKNLKNFKF